MYRTEIMPPELLEKAKEIRTSLKEVKDEWLETKPKGGGKYLGVNTVRQILDNSCTYGWSFRLIKEWKDEVYKFNKQTRAYEFDGYVFHVKGELEIPLLGVRSQYGSKVAIGGANNQDSGYKAAASNCLNKCASLFGVGESVYSKFTVEQEDNQYEALQNNPDYQVGNQQQMYQQPQQQMGYVDNQQQMYQQPYPQQQVYPRQ